MKILECIIMIIFRNDVNMVPQMFPAGNGVPAIIIIIHEIADWNALGSYFLCIHGLWYSIVIQESWKKESEITGKNSPMTILYFAAFNTIRYLARNLLFVLKCYFQVKWGKICSFRLKIKKKKKKAYFRQLKCSKILKAAVLGVYDISRTSVRTGYEKIGFAW